MMRIGRIPVAADSFEAVGLRFEVADMDGKRIDKVVVQPLIGTSRGKSNAILTRTLLISYQLWLIVRLVLMAIAPGMMNSGCNRASADDAAPVTILMTRLGGSRT